MEWIDKSSAANIKRYTLRDYSFDKDRGLELPGPARSSGTKGMIYVKRLNSPGQL